MPPTFLNQLLRKSLGIPASSLTPSNPFFILPPGQFFQTAKIVKSLLWKVLMILHCT
jgi:hypothetical protein